MTKLQSHDRETIQPMERAPEAQAEGFAFVRQAHESEIAEDYVELIAELIETRGEARPVEIAERLGVKPPTVTKNISRLKSAGLVRRERYRAIFLTEQGQALAEACQRRHRIISQGWGTSSRSRVQAPSWLGSPTSPDALRPCTKSRASTRPSGSGRGDGPGFQSP